MRKFTKAALGAAALLCPQAVWAAPVLSPTDFIIAIDSDPPLSLSNSPELESSINAHDFNTATKYLNFGELDTGIVITPAAGSTTVQSMLLYTANDAPERDPASWRVFGTNDPYDHLANNNGTSVVPGVTWTQLGTGAVAMPAARFTAGPLLSFANTNPYTTYRILFPTVKNAATANSMQVAEIELYPSLDGPTSSASILGDFDSSSAFQLPNPDSRFNAGEAPRWALDDVGVNLNYPSQSGFPGNESPANVVDGTVNKYLNFGSDNSGFIVTPASGASTVRSFTIQTANDAVDRDPASYELYGTNSAIASTNNSYGAAEPWTLISAGALTLPPERDTLGSVVPVANNASYTSYKMLFPTRVGPAGLMQIAEASFYSTPDGMGTDILNPGDPVLAIDASTTTGLQSKYLNFGENNSGVIVTPAAGPKVVTSLQITTANDFPERDPATYEIYGTNAPIATVENGRGTAEAWTLISSGALALPAERLTEAAPVAFANTTAYSSYKILFPTVKDAMLATAMQISKLQLFDSAAPSDPDFDNDGDVDGQDFLVWQRGLGVGTTNATGDADGNGAVNGADLAAWKSKFGLPPATAAAGSVPEPATAVLALVVCGLAAALAGRGTVNRR